MEQIEQIIEKWDEILNTVKEEYEISVMFPSIHGLKPLSVFAVENNNLYILVPSEQIGLSYISKKYLAPLRVAIVEITEIEYEIEFILPEQTKKLNLKQQKHPAMTEDESNLNPNYTFDTFVVGNNNRFAHSASFAVAESPGEVYNPLYLIRRSPDLEKPILCIPSVTLSKRRIRACQGYLRILPKIFTNEVIDSIRNGNAIPP